MGSSSSSHSELPCSYVPVPDGPHSPADPPRQKKALFISFGLLLLLSLVAFNADYPHSTGHGHHLSMPSTPPNELEYSPHTVPRSTLKPFSRGVSSGVSDKSSWVLKSSNGESYPWNNSMLSWQRTAYHFQPEKNWMNGNFILLILLYFHSVILLSLLILACLFLSF